MDSKKNCREGTLHALLNNAIELQKKLKKLYSLPEQIDLLISAPAVQEILAKFPLLETILKGADRKRYLLFIFLHLDWSRVLVSQIVLLADAERRILQLIDRLEKTDHFYEVIGGLLGYYISLLRLLLQGNVEDHTPVARPLVCDCQTMNPFLWETCYVGTSSLKKVAEIYVAGGSGDRLHLHDALTGESLPVASLQFGGRSLLEWLFRDLVAREYLYYRLFQKQVLVPVLIMTSEEKNNDREIRLLLERNSYFNRGKKSIFVVSQPLVPAVTTEGHFAFNEAYEIVSKPGGHGVVWKIFQDNGLFTLLSKKGISHLLVRQVNNPIASLDHTLMSFFGFGIKMKKTFGFVGCPRHPGFAEGMLVQRKTSQGEVCVENIEYTEFDGLSKRVPGILEEDCPANTNILFASISEIQKVLQQDALPGIMINAKTECDVLKGNVATKSKIVRLESMMQAVSKNMASKFGKDGGEIATFVGLYERDKSLSVTKRAFEEGKNPYETPESCLYNWFESCRRLFSEVCGFLMPVKISLPEFLLKGPNFISFFHPALGPLWSIIGQKIRGGCICQNSELELEISELYMENLHLQGSFRIIALQPMGSCRGGEKLQMSKKVGRAYIKNFVVENKGVKNTSLKDHLNRMEDRIETCTIVLEGQSEVVIENVKIRGSFELIVPDGMRATLIANKNNTFEVVMSPYRIPWFEYQITWNPTEAPKLWLHKS